MLRMMNRSSLNPLTRRSMEVPPQPLSSRPKRRDLLFSFVLTQTSKPQSTAPRPLGQFSPPSPRIVSYWKPRPRDEW
jgi:hypothetical protein